jgi:CheY-like chemotaxis protein
MNPLNRILYVEDEQDDVFFMKDAFRRLGPPVSFHAVEDGERAISYLAGNPPYADRDQHPLPACVLLDLNLPIRSGFEVLEWLRGRPEFKELPVVIFSSSGRPEDRCRARQLGATDYMLKPTSGREFLDTARQLTERWMGAPGPQFG